VDRIVLTNQWWSFAKSPCANQLHDGRVDL
jgi:hypothetical protein